MDAIIEKIKIPAGSDFPAHEKTVISIPCGKVETDLALRVYDADQNQVLYRSSRLGEIETTETGMVAEVSEDFSLVGMDYELKDIRKREVLQKGKITSTSTKPKKEKNNEGN